MGDWASELLALAPRFNRAPSAHNTQPAVFSVPADGAGDTVLVGWDPACELTVGDPTRRDLWLSVGSAIEAVCIAAADAGLGVRVEWDVDARSHRIARLHESRPGESGSDDSGPDESGPGESLPDDSIRINLRPEISPLRDPRQGAAPPLGSGPGERRMGARWLRRSGPGDDRPGDDRVQGSGFVERRRGGRRLLESDVDGDRLRGGRSIFSDVDGDRPDGTDAGARPTTSDPDGFTSAELRARRTARGPYAEPAVTASELAAIPEPAPARLDIVDPSLVDELLPVADRWSYGTPAQVAELRRWLRLDRRDPAYRRDGLTDVALAMTSLQARALRVALAPRVWAGLRRVGGPALLASSSTIAGRGTVVAFSVPTADAERPSQMGEHGRALLRTWLAARRHGLSVHPLSVLIDAPDTATRLHAAVSDGGSRTVLSVFRIGRPVDEPVESARRPG